jgi:hypothetical protein
VAFSLRMLESDISSHNNRFQDIVA